jgi:hypothetical protein
MSIKDRYSGEYTGTTGSLTGTYYSTKENIYVNWAVVTPDATIYQNGESLGGSSFDVTQHVYVLDGTGGIIPSLTQSGWDATSISYTRSQLEEALVDYPRVMRVQVTVSGNYGAWTGTHTGTISVLNPAPVIDLAYVTDSSGTSEWTPSSMSQIDTVPATGMFDTYCIFNNSGYGDITALRIYTGDYAGFSIDDSTLYATYQVGGIPVYQVDATLEASLTNEETNIPHAIPYYLAFVPEDVIGTGEAFASIGITADYLRSSGDSWMEELDLTVSGILYSGVEFSGQKIFRSIFGSATGYNTGSGRLGVGLPIEDWNSLSAGLQAVYNSGDTINGLGIFPRELMHVSGVGRFDGPVQLMSIAKATLTGGAYPAAVHNGRIVYVNNAVGGAQLCYSDGTNWRRASDLTILT